MSRQSSDTTPAFYEILWERTKRPLIFVLVCLAAAIALFLLQKEKSSTDKIENAPFYLVPKEFEEGHRAKITPPKPGESVTDYNKTYADQMRYVRIGYSNKLTEKIDQKIDADYLKPGSGQNNEYPKDKPKAEHLKRLFQWNVSSLHHQYFVNEEEILKAFYVAANKNRETDLKNLESKINKEFDENAKNTAKFFDANLKETTNLAKLTEKYDSDTTQSFKDRNQLVKKILDDISIRPLNHSDLSAGGKLESKIKDIAEEVGKEKLRNETTRINNEYDYISGELFKTLKNKDEVKEIFNFSSPNPVSKNFMDSKTGLVIVYHLADITLKAIIVFGLLYVILIPLKHIFFITTSTDELVDQSKKVFDKSGAAAAAGGLGRAILVTVTTITIGAATLAGQFPNSQSNDNPETANSQRNLSDPRKTSDVTPPGAANPLDPNALRELTANFATLNRNFENLKKEIEDAGLRTIPGDVTAIKSSLSGIESVVGKRDNPKDIETLIGKLNDVSETLNGDSENSIQRRINSLQSQLKPAPTGSPETVYDQIRTVENNVSNFANEEFNGNSVKTASPQNLKEALSGIWSALGTKQYLDQVAHNGQSQPLPAQTARANNVLQSIDFVDTKLGRTEKSISHQLNEFRTELENVKRDLRTVSNNIGDPNNAASANTIFGYNKQIAAKTTQMGRFMIGESGGFRSLFGQLLLGEKYYITPMLIEDLKSPLLIENLKLQNKLPQNFLAGDEELSEWNKNLGVLIDELKSEMSKNKGRKTIVSAKFLQETLGKSGFSPEIQVFFMERISEFSLIY